MICHRQDMVNSSPVDKMAAISQTIFSDVFSWVKSFVFWLKFNWSLFLRVSWQYHSIDLDNSLGPNRRQAIIWINAEPFYLRIYATLYRGRWVNSWGHRTRLKMKTIFPAIGILIRKIRRSWDRLIFIMRIPILLKTASLYWDGPLSGDASRRQWTRTLVHLTTCCLFIAKLLSELTDSLLIGRAGTNFNKV